MDNQPIRKRLVELSEKANLKIFPGGKSTAMTVDQFIAEMVQRASLGHYTLDLPEEDVSADIINHCYENHLDWCMNENKSRFIFNWIQWY